MYVLVLFSSKDFNFSFSSNNAFFCSNEIKHEIKQQDSFTCTKQKLIILQFDRGTPYQMTKLIVSCD